MLEAGISRVHWCHNLRIICGLDVCRLHHEVSELILYIYKWYWLLGALLELIRLWDWATKLVGEGVCIGKA